MRTAIALAVLSAALLSCRVDPTPAQAAWVEEGPLIEWAVDKTLHRIPTEVFERALAEYEADPSQGFVMPLGEPLLGRLPPEFTPQLQEGVLELLIRQDDEHEDIRESGCRLIVDVVTTGRDTIRSMRCSRGGCEDGEGCDRIRLERAANWRVYCACNEGAMFETDPSAAKSTCHLEVRHWLRGGLPGVRIDCFKPCEDEADRACVLDYGEPRAPNLPANLRRFHCDCRKRDGEF